MSFRVMIKEQDRAISQAQLDAEHRRLNPKLLDTKTVINPIQEKHPLSELFEIHALVPNVDLRNSKVTRQKLEELEQNLHLHLYSLGINDSPLNSNEKGFPCTLEERIKAKHGALISLLNTAEVSPLEDLVPAKKTNNSILAKLCVFAIVVALILLILNPVGLPIWLGLLFLVSTVRLAVSVKIDSNNHKNWKEWQNTNVGRIHRIYCKMRDFKNANPGIDPISYQVEYNGYWTSKMNRPNLGSDYR